jgi:hypothetical protein
MRDSLKQLFEQLGKVGLLTLEFVRNLSRRPAVVAASISILVADFLLTKLFLSL